MRSHFQQREFTVGSKNGISSVLYGEHVLLETWKVGHGSEPGFCLEIVQAAVCLSQQSLHVRFQVLAACALLLGLIFF